ncbi:MAG: PTS sugar transporter subunit IIA [Eubacteriales bacterium]|nr:PTS sugar transporter subunit IIA [Eubacteriales bacterium]
MQILHENLEKGYLVVKVDSSDKFDTLDQMGKLMVEKGFVKESYVEAVKEREKVFPTGLPMEAFGVAIPHTDSIHVNKKAIMCGIFEQPNEFVMMGTDDDKVQCEMAFMLAIISPDDQIAMLAQLVETCQDVSVLHTLKEAKDMDAIVEIMDGLMS